MTESGKRWLKGCGIGCGLGCLLVIVGLVVIGVAGWGLVKNAFHGMARAAESHEQIVQRYGLVEDWTPPADGAPSAARLEAFLAAREALEIPARTLAESLEEVDLAELERSETSLRDVPRVLRALSDVVEAVGLYLNERNQVLLEVEMGLGEYTYLYALVYWSWLGHRPEDGLILDIETESHSGAHVEIRGFDEENSTFGPRENRRRYRRYMIALLRNQLDALPAQADSAEQSDAGALAGPAASEELPDGSWRETLAGELRRFENGLDRTVWQDGLPPAIEEALEPFRSRLEAGYREGTNLFELPPREGAR